MDVLTAHDPAEKRMIERAARLQVPITVTFELSPICNLSCRMCYVRKSAARVKTLGGLQPVEAWIRMAELLQRQGVLFVTLTGGEPLLFPGFRQLCTALHELGMIYTINTNGTLINAEWADFLREVSPRRINITLYGDSAATYRELCGSGDAYEKTLRGIRLLKERGLTVKVNASAVRANRHELQAIYDRAASLDCPVHLDTYMIPKLDPDQTENGEESDCRLNPEEYAEAEFLSHKNELPPEQLDAYIRARLAAVEHMAEQTEEERSRSSGITCLAGNCSFCITWDGFMRPCISMGSGGVQVLKEPDEKQLKAAWNQICTASKTLKLNYRCTTCRLRPLCKVCVASARLETGAWDGVPDYLCRGAEALFRLYQAYSPNTEESQ